MLRRYDKGELIWVAPGDIRYDMEDVLFLLPWKPLLEEGRYPLDPVESGYAGCEGRRTGIRHTAPYEKACQVAAELNRRLARTREDRYLAEAYYCREWDRTLTEEEIYVSIGREVDRDWRDVRRRIKSAVSYIASGPCPRWLNCIDCAEYGGCPREKRVGKTYREWVRSRSHRHAIERR